MVWASNRPSDDQNDSIQAERTASTEGTKVIQQVCFMPSPTAAAALTQYWHEWGMRSSKELQHSPALSKEVVVAQRALAWRMNNFVLGRFLFLRAAAVNGGYG